MEEAMQMFRINFLGPSMLIRELLPFMGRAGDTHIVNIGSMGGFQGSSKFPGLSYYSASKAALACLTECLSVEYQRFRYLLSIALRLVPFRPKCLPKPSRATKHLLKPKDMAEFIGDFALNGHKFMNGKIIPVALSNP